MILTGNEIIKRVSNGSIIISPFDAARINPNSYNLTLNKELLVYDEDILDMKRFNKFHRETIPEDGLVLQPGKLYLGCTNEYTASTKVVPMLEGRSSLARLGLFVHISAGFGDVSFEGKWTLELSCVQPIRIYPNIECCQIYYHTYLGDDGIKYGANSKYQYAEETQTSKMYLEWADKYENRQEEKKPVYIPPADNDGD